MKLDPIDYDPFAEDSAQVPVNQDFKLTPVEHDPFEDEPTSDDQLLGGESPSTLSNLWEQAKAGYHEYQAGQAAKRTIELGENINEPGSSIVHSYEFGKGNPHTPTPKTLNREMDEQLDRYREHKDMAGDVEFSESTLGVIQAESFGDAWEQFKSDPVTVISELGARSAAASMPGLILGTGMGAVAGPPGFAAGMGLGSGTTEHAASMMEALQEEDVDLSNKESILEAVSDPELMGRVRKRAAIKATVVGTVDAVSGGLATKTIAPKALTNVAVRQAVNVPAQTAAQASLGAAGEGLGEYAATGEIHPGQIAAEAAGEFVTAPVDVASAVASTRPRVTPEGVLGEEMSQAVDGTGFDIDGMVTEVLDPANAQQRREQHDIQQADTINTISSATTVDEAIDAATSQLDTSINIPDPTGPLAGKEAVEFFDDQQQQFAPHQQQQEIDAAFNQREADLVAEDQTLSTQAYTDQLYDQAMQVETSDVDRYLNEQQIEPANPAMADALAAAEVAAKVEADQAEAKADFDPAKATHTDKATGQDVIITDIRSSKAAVFEFPDGSAQTRKFDAVLEKEAKLTSSGVVEDTQPETAVSPLPVTEEVQQPASEPSNNEVFKPLIDQQDLQPEETLSTSESVPEAQTDVNSEQPLASKEELQFKTNGDPYATEKSAEIAAKRTGSDFTIKAVEGGFAIARKVEPDAEQLSTDQAKFDPTPVINTDDSALEEQVDKLEREFIARADTDQRHYGEVSAKDVGRFIADRVLKTGTDPSTEEITEKFGLSEEASVFTNTMLEQYGTNMVKVYGRERGKGKLDHDTFRNRILGKPSQSARARLEQRAKDRKAKQSQPEAGTKALQRIKLKEDFETEDGSVVQVVRSADQVLSEIDSKLDGVNGLLSYMGTSSSLAAALKKFGTDIDADDVQAIRDLAAKHRYSGMDTQEAGIAAVKEMQTELYEQRKVYVADIEKQGGKAPKRTDVPPPKDNETVEAAKIETAVVPLAEEDKAALSKIKLKEDFETEDGSVVQVVRSADKVIADIEVAVPTVDQEVVDTYNRTTHVAGGRDFNAELKSTAESLLEEIAAKKHTLDTDEQKAQAKILVEQHLNDTADFIRWDSNESARNPSWMVTGRGNRDTGKYNQKMERYGEQYSERVEKLEAQRKRITDTLYNMRPESVKTGQAFKKDVRDIAFAVGGIGGYLNENKNELAKDARKWAAPKIHKLITRNLEANREAVISEIQKMEQSKSIQDLGGLVKVIGPRSNAAKLIKDLLGTKAIEQVAVKFSLEQSLSTDTATEFTQEQTEQAIAKVLNTVSEKTGLTVEVIHSDNIPPDIKEQIPANKHPKGFTVGDNVYLVHNHIGSAKDAQITFAHEVKGHFGVERVIGDNWSSIVEKYASLKKRGGPKFQSIHDEVVSRYGELEAASEVKEFIAIAAERRESEGSIGTFMRKVRELFAKGLRAIGFTRPIGLTDIDLILSRSEQFLETGETDVQEEETAQLDSQAMFAHQQKSDADTILSQWKKKLELSRRSTDQDFVISVKAPLILRELGVLKQMTLSKRRLLAIKQKHAELPTNVIQDLPKLLADPLVIYVRKQGDTNAVIEVMTDAGEPILVGMRDGEIKTITPKNHWKGKQGADILAGEIERSTVIYARDKEALADAKAVSESRLKEQYSLGGRSNNVRGQGFNKKILYKSDIVKKHGREGEAGPLFSLSDKPEFQTTRPAESDKRNKTSEQQYTPEQQATHVSISYGPEFKAKQQTEPPPKPDNSSPGQSSPPPQSGSNAYDRLFNALGAKDENLVTKAKRFARRQFQSGGLLPRAVFAEKIIRDSKINEQEFDIAHHLGVFDKAVAHGYGKGYDKLTEAQKSKINQQFTSTDIDKSIPQPVREAIVSMRFEIKMLSLDYANALREQVSQLEGAEAEAKGQLLETIINNLDIYAHRSYKAFDDPAWPKKVSREVVDNAALYLEQRFQDMPKAEREEQVSRIIKTILEEGTAFESVEAFVRESKLGAQDLSVLKHRKDIAPEIRALLGEYEDVQINFAKTITKMSRLVHNQKFLERLQTIGFDEGFLFTENNKPIDKSVVKIAADSSEVYAPLNGFYTYTEVNQALKDALGKEQMADWFRTIVRLNGMVKYGKTILSPTTAARNWMSAFFFSVANGHFDITQMRHSISGLREYFTHNGVKAKITYLKKLKRLGVVYDTPYAGEMMDLLADSKLETTLFQKGPLKGLKSANQYAQKFYQYGDDFWKILGWENEKALLMKHKGLSEPDAEVEAAERIRNTYPTYSMTGRFVQHLRRFPLAGTFVSFPSEIIRTTYHMLRYLKQDMKDSPAYAARKVTGLALASSFAFAAQVLSRSMLGIDDDEEEAVRRMGPDWMQNSNLMFTGRDENGNLRFVDVSFLDPYNYWKRPINAILRDQPIQDALEQSAKEAFMPFFGQDIAFGAIMEAFNNKKASGGPIFNEEDTAFNQTKAISDHLRKRLQPGVFSNIERTLKAAQGERSASGKQYSLEDELLAWVGFRVSTFDPKTALYYRSYEFKDRKRDATQILTTAAKNPNQIDDNELMDAYRTARESRLRAYEDMVKLVAAAVESGLPRSQAYRQLVLSGVSKKDANALVRGVIPLWKPNRLTLRNTIKKAKALYGPDMELEFRRRERLILREAATR